MTYNTIQFLVRFHNGFDNCKLKRKTQGHFGEKTQNSSQIQKKKLKPKSKKTQKPPTPVEMSCQKNVQKNPLLYALIKWLRQHQCGQNCETPL